MATDVSEFVEEQSGREVAPSTMTKYGRWLERFESWRPGSDIDADMLRSWDSYLQDDERADYPWSSARGPSPPASYSYRSRVVALSAVKLWAKHEFDSQIDIEVQNIAEGEPADFEPEILDRTAVRAVISGASGDCDNPGCDAAIKVGYDAIMRGAEVAAIKREDVDLGDETLYVRAVKGSEATNIELGTEAMAALRSHIQDHPDRDLLFTNAYDNRWSADTWNQHFRRKHHEAGFHAFARHSAITNRLKDGEDFGDVYLKSRHSSPRTTLKYVNLVGREDAPDWL